MSIAWDRLLRMMRYDPYLPMNVSLVPRPLLVIVIV
jgi:hypothetical protein